ncbi:MAG: hypothetical protein NXI24_22495 [bacterium]|nr:hypothetical protein [bacterium]
MAKPGRQTFEKRAREKKRKEKQQEKTVRKAQRKADKEEGTSSDDVFDIDLDMIDVEQTLTLPEEHPLRIAVEKKLAEAEQAQLDAEAAENEGDAEGTPENEASGQSAPPA